MCFCTPFFFFQSKQTTQFRYGLVFQYLINSNKSYQLPIAYKVKRFRDFFLNNNQSSL